jgi:chemotaxis protein CheX
MSNQKTFVLVNCSRVFERTVRNLLPSVYAVQTASKEDVEKKLCEKVPVDTLPAISLNNGESINEAKRSVSAMLAGQEAQASRPEPDNSGCKKPIDPDCIIYQVTDKLEADIQIVRSIRRKCRFRDIPVLIVTSYSDLPHARQLIAHGANDIIVLSGAPEQLMKKLTSALDPVGTRLPVITKVINPYISATIDLLTTMAGLHPEKKDVFLKKNYRAFGDISAIMPFTGKVEGEVVVCFEEALAREVVGRIVSTSPEELTKDELKDGVGEIVNIIAGNAKAALSSTEYQHTIGLPTVVLGQGHEISHPGNAPCIVVIFDVGGQPMAILVSMAVK